VFIFSSLFNMTMPIAQRMPRVRQKRKALSNKVAHIEWPACTGLIKLNGPKNRTAVSSKVFIVSSWSEAHASRCHLWVMRRFHCRGATYEDEVVARIAPDPQQDPFVLGVLHQLRHVPSVPDFLVIDRLNNITGPETCLCGR
jgi:hypothetical protein